MKILYLGREDPHSTSRHRCDALRRLGHEVLLLDVARGASLSHPLTQRLHFRTGYYFLQLRMRRWCAQAIAQMPDAQIVWIDSGELIGRGCVEVLKKTGAPVILFNTDDPPGSRDGRRFDRVLKALSDYDLCITVRDVTAKELLEHGARRVLRVMMSYDEAMHAPYANQGDIPSAFRSDVAFIGTWMRHEARDEFLYGLVKRGIPLSIWGNRWQLAPRWKELKPYWRGGNIGGRDYVGAIQGAKLCLGMLSKGNRDQHTQRSLETPYAGGVLCAERTSEHLEMFRENKEAVFWSDVEECATKCRWLLDHPTEREKIREAGMERVRSLLASNEKVCRAVLDEVAKIKA